MRSRVQFLARLPYARLACLFLAAAQLMPLPEEPEDCPSRSLGVVRAGPDPWSQRSPLEGGISMPLDDKQLHQIAQDYPWFMFTVEEIATLCNVSRDFVSKVRAANDSPFCLNKCRPEWFADWMRGHGRKPNCHASVTRFAPTFAGCTCTTGSCPNTCARKGVTKRYGPLPAKSDLPMEPSIGLKISNKA